MALESLHVDFKLSARLQCEIAGPCKVPAEPCFPAKPSRETAQTTGFQAATAVHNQASRYKSVSDLD